MIGADIENISKRIHHGWAFVLLLLGACIAGYGLLIPGLGLYWDEWPVMWFLEAGGEEVFHDVFAIDRPYSAWSYRLTTSFLGANIPAWKIFGLFTRWLTGLTLWWVLQIVWPARRREVALVALLFVLYPGFSQQPIAMIYSHNWLNIVFQNLSFAAMLLAVRRPSQFRLFYVSSLLLAVVTIWPFEYMFGLEFLRPLFLWIVLRETFPDKRKRFGRVVLLWIPYFLIALGFVFWRVSFVSFSLYQPSLLNEFGTEFMYGLQSLINSVISDLVEVTVLAWGSLFSITAFPQIEGRWVLISWILAAIFFLIFAIFFRWMASQDDPTVDRAYDPGWTRDALVVAIASILLAGWPTWIPQLDLRLSFPFDRFTMAFMFGSSLLLVALLNFVLRSNRALTGTIALIAALSIGFHFRNTVDYVRATRATRQFLWQLASRAPALESGTAIVVNDLQLDYMTDLSLSMAINALYGDQSLDDGLDLFLFNARTRRGRTLPDPTAGGPIHQPVRATAFDGRSSQVLYIEYSPPRCLRVLDPSLESTTVFPELAQGIANSRPDLILAEREFPPPRLHSIAGPAPDPSWCMYVQQAGLAVQNADWQTAARLGDQAFASLERPVHALEFIPFVEGYARVDRIAEAVRYTSLATTGDPTVRPVYCRLWLDIESTLAPDADSRLMASSVLEVLSCP